MVQWALSAVSINAAAEKKEAEKGNPGEIVEVSASRRSQIYVQKRWGEWSHPLFYMSVHDLDLMRWIVDEDSLAVHAISSPTPDTNRPMPSSAIFGLKTMLLENLK